MNEPNDLTRRLHENALVGRTSLVRNWLNFTAGRVRGRAHWAKEQLTIARLKHASTTKPQFVKDIRAAIAAHAGYAAGKLGRTAQYMIQYEIVLEREKDKTKIEQYESQLEFMCVKQQGIFPGDTEFCRRYSRFYIKHIKNLDCLGICYLPDELKILKYYGLNNKLLWFPYQEPDMSIPANEDNCYLPFFRDKKVLIICPFAGLLKDRATKEMFEGVWSKTGKKWFHPKSVDAVEFSYGFSPETHKRYSTVLELFEEIEEQLQRRDFDIALIGAAGLAIPIASTIKNMGKIAIDLGGHLQIVFGVIGQRWRKWAHWEKDYFNEYWIEMPARYRPRESDVCDNGAYW